MDELDAHPEADWIYPNIDMFGIDRSWDYGGSYSVLLHTEMNVSEAGSLVRRRVFERGVLFDPDFKLGWEDWDFFLSAARAGFRGRNLEEFGFQYRKRPESMLANSARDEDALRGAMRLKHGALFKPSALASIEHSECPRYAIHVLDAGEVLCCVDPVATDVSRLRGSAFEQAFWCARLAPGRTHRPPITIVMSSETLDGLRQAGLLHWALWRLEVAVERSGVALLKTERAQDGRITVARRASEPGAHLGEGAY
jgi:hypothetical protein